MHLTCHDPIRPAIGIRECLLQADVALHERVILEQSIESSNTISPLNNTMARPTISGEAADIAIDNADGDAGSTDRLHSRHYAE